MPNRGWSQEAKNLHSDHHDDRHYRTTIILLQSAKITVQLLAGVVEKPQSQRLQDV